MRYFAFLWNFQFGSMTVEKKWLIQRIPVKGISRSGFNLNFLKCHLRKKTVVRFTLLLTSWKKHTKENWLWIKVEWIKQRRKTLKCKGDSAIDSWNPERIPLLSKLLMLLLYFWKRSDWLMVKIYTVEKRLMRLLVPTTFFGPWQVTRGKTVGHSYPLGAA